jgi:hypothetical protein
MRWAFKQREEGGSSRKFTFKLHRLIIFFKLVFSLSITQTYIIDEWLNNSIERVLHSSHQHLH